MKELRSALADAAITLPSLRIDLAGLAREAPRPRVVPGGRPVGLAARLTVALWTRRATEAG
ncbi:hypothetical protein [Streptomyces sp. NPDC047079]|uniref:hypothetical protein n=1 Tax=Streptomyces sp. NPDC047079 TaxID=3154607 RepID=UPI0033E00706